MAPIPKKELMARLREARKKNITEREESLQKDRERKKNSYVKRNSMSPSELNSMSPSGLNMLMYIHQTVRRRPELNQVHHTPNRLTHHIFNQTDMNLRHKTSHVVPTFLWK